MNLLKRAYNAAKSYFVEKFRGSALKEKYLADYFQDANPGESYFEKSLEVASAFRRARKSRNAEHLSAALSKFEAIKKEFSDEEAGALATDIWMSIEAYQATGNLDYVKRAKKDGNVLIDELIGDYRFARSSRRGERLESKAEDQLLAASALLQLYELSKKEKYKKQAEVILDFFEKRHVVRRGNGEFFVDRFETSDGSYVFHSADKKQEAYLRKLAAITYMNAYHITGNYAGQAKRFFDSSEKSLLLYSEAARTFKMKDYSKNYKELLKKELENPQRSTENLAGVMHEPIFNVEVEDLTLFREMLGVNFSVALGAGLVWAVLPFMPAVAAAGTGAWGVSIALSCAVNALTLPLAGRAADRFGKKLMLGAGVLAYAGSIVLTPWLIDNYLQAGLYASQALRGALCSAGAPALAALVTEAVPPSRRATALSESGAAYTLGYGSGSLFGGILYNAASGFASFAAAAALPALMVTKPLLNYRKMQQKRKALDSLFADSETSGECKAAAVMVAPASV